MNLKKSYVEKYGYERVTTDRNSPLAYTEPFDAGFITNQDYDYAKATYNGGFGDSRNLAALHTREVRFAKPDLFVVRDTLTSRDGKSHDYEMLLHLDTTSVKRIPEYKNAVISELGGEWEIAIIPIDEDEDSVELIETSGATEPIMQGWFNGRNEEDFHKAITVSRKVRGVNDFVFNTLLIPVGKSDPVPTVRKREDGNLSVNIKGKEYTVNLSALECAT